MGVATEHAGSAAASPSAASAGSLKRKEKRIWIHYKTLRQPAPAPRPTECFRNGWQPPGVTQPDNGLATMGRGQWLTGNTPD